MQERHKDRNLYFKEQGLTTLQYVIPYVNAVKKVDGNMRVLEVGCGEGGNLTPFMDLGCECFGIDISASQIEKAKEFLATHPNHEKLSLIADDVYHLKASETGTFDLIFLRDVIEHIPNQEKFLAFIQDFLSQNGVIFFGFPPWIMPFGGHQQICSSKFLSFLPYFHILPAGIYKGILKMFGESKTTIESLIEIKDTGISTYRFKKIIRQLNYGIEKETYFVINPNYETKFKLKQRRLWSVFKIPFLSDFYTTAYYCVLSKPKKV
jgi:SAM-dependent methyltransferase